MCIDMYIRIYANVMGVFMYVLLTKYSYISLFVYTYLCICKWWAVSYVNKSLYVYPYIYMYVFTIDGCAYVFIGN